MVSFTLRPLYPPFSLDRKVGGTQGEPGRGGEEKHSSPCRPSSHYTHWVTPNTNGRYKMCSGHNVWGGQLFYER